MKYSKDVRERAQRMLAKGLSQSDVADAVGVHWRTISDWVAKEDGFRQQVERITAEARSAQAAAPKKIDPRVKLMNLLDEYIGSRDPELAPNSVVSYRQHLRRYQRFCGTELTLDHLNTELVEAFFRWMRDKEYSAATRRGCRVTIVVLWNWLWEEDRIDRAPKVRRLREPKSTLPIAWTPEEVKQLADACLTLQGSYTPSRQATTKGWEIPKAWYMRSLVLSLYSSGLRLGDALNSLRWCDIDLAGRIKVLVHKTQREVIRQLSPSALDAVKKTEPWNREYVWPLRSDRRRFFGDFNKLVEKSGIRPGTTKFLRRAGATQIAKLHGEHAAQAFCDHRDVSTTRSNYIDPSQIERPELVVPDIY